MSFSAASSLGVRFGFITALGTDDLQRAVQAAGSWSLIREPFTVDDFRRVWKEILAQGV